ncbi:MAG: isopenicillin N synthase family oxygenase [SAR86 cluster bacterium]|uniref:2-oxoglutarate-dependent ethylene/succinate-forming enzyme n=1 Tax=SAR86 cluster bacterium TaxID=2030880 RepID=A0A937M1P6_9GAMM|nr:isopenicillin N synthase family oxygenase [SAR86 cluster bacterium]
MSKQLIPELSYLDIKDGNKEALKELKNALTEYGFFSIIDHGLDTELLKNSYAYSKKFFDLPVEEKSKYAFPQNAGARGYTPFGKETALGEVTPDQKEFWHHGPNIDSSYDSRIHTNINVNEIIGFNDNFDQLFNAINKLGMNVLKIIALLLNKEANFFDSWAIKGNSLLRLIHYPPVTNDSNNLRARAHEDINLITLLVGAEESGLEVKSKNGEWIPIKASSNAIVCNIGDMMQLVTDGMLLSTTHRVINYTNSRSKSRYSMPFFLHPAPNITLKSIFNEDDEGVLADDFLNERLKAIKLY